MNENHMHDEFDRYLDGLVTGRNADTGDALATFARDIHARKGVSRLDPDRREAIWREVTHSASQGAGITTGGAGPLWQPTLVEPSAHNPWLRDPAQSDATLSGGRGTIAKAQTALAIFATLALLVTTVALLQDREGGDGAPGNLQFAVVPTRLVAATQHSPAQPMDVTGTGDLVMPPTVVPGMESTNTGELVSPPTAEGTNDVAGTGDLVVPSTSVPDPPSSGDDWLAPITPEECIIREHVSGARDLPERAYVPVTTLSTEDAEDVANTLRQYEACLLAQQNMDGYVSDHFNAEASDSIDNRQSQAAKGEPISEAYAGHDRVDFIIVDEGMEMTPASTMRITEGAGLYQPHHAMLLADGRIAIPATHVYPEGIDIDRLPAFISSIAVLVNVDGTWLVDERLPFCVGECDEFWASMQFPATPPNTIATPGTVTGNGTVALAPLPVDDNIWRECPAHDGPRTLGSDAGTEQDGSADRPWPSWGPAVPPTIPCEIGWPPLPPEFTPVPLG